MKILIYSLNYSPELTGIGKYSGEMSVWLAEQGHEVRVVTAPPYYPKWTVEKGYSGKWYKRECTLGVQVWRCPLYVPKQVSGLKRIIHLASFALSSLPVMLRHLLWKPDIVLVIEPPVFCAPTGLLMSRLSGAKCWLHIQDFEVDAAFELGIIPFAWMRRVVSAIEYWLMSRFDYVSTISNSMLDHLNEKGVEAPLLFPNWVDLSGMLFDEVGGKLFRTDLNIADSETLCLYSGNISVKQGLEILLDVVARLPDCRFVICGDGASRKSLQQQFDRLSLSNVTFLPLQPLHKFAAMLSAADIHLVIQKRGAADLVMPSKITNILSIGGLALVSAECNSELGRLAEGDEACVYRCVPEDVDGMVNAINILSHEGELPGVIKRRAKAYAENYIGMDRVLGQFEERLKKAVWSNGCN